MLNKHLTVKDLIKILLDQDMGDKIIIPGIEIHDGKIWTFDSLILKDSNPVTSDGRNVYIKRIKKRQQFDVIEKVTKG